MTMPRTLEEILAHADDLASKFEEYEPNDADEIDVDVMQALRAAVLERSKAERHLVDAIQHARDAGMTWAAIGTTVGTSGEAARQRYAKHIA